MTRSRNRNRSRPSPSVSPSPSPRQETVFLYPCGPGHVVAKNTRGAIVTCSCFQPLPQCDIGGQAYPVELPRPRTLTPQPTLPPQPPPPRKPYRRRH
jgi:hypothetical protein